MRWRQRYRSRSKLMTVLRLALGGITAAAPRSSRSALSQSASNALSPSRAPKARPSISGRAPTLSWCWPGSRTKRTKLPRASTRATRGRRRGRRSWSSGRRASGRWPGSGSPFCAARLWVGGDDGAVDQGVFEVRLIGQAREDALDYAALHPATKTLEDAVPVAEIARQVAPGHARSHAPQHRLKKQAIVFGRRPRIGGLTGQQRRDLLPDRVAHHEPRPLKHRPTPPKHGLHTPGQPGKPSMSTGPRSAMLTGVVR